VQVDEAEPGHLEQRRRQDLPVGDDRGDVGLGGSKAFLEVGIARLIGLEDLDAGLQRRFFHGRGVELELSPGGAVGVGHHEGDLDVGFEQSPQARHRPFGSSEEDGPQRASSLL
jgi:hypothetical protein